MAWGLFDAQRTFAPDFSERDIRLMKRVLKLSEADADAVNALYDSYCKDLAAQGDEIRKIVSEILERAEVLQDSTLVSKAQPMVDGWEKQAEKLKSGFLSDLRSILTKEQEERWPIVEREMRRLKQIGLGRLPGESIDLIRVLEETLPGKVEANPEIEKLTQQYADDLDRALKARAAFLDEHSEKFSELLSKDVQAAETQWKDAAKLRSAIREINYRYLRQIGELLAPDDRAKLDRAFFEMAHTRLIKATRGENYIRKSLDLKGLTEGQRSQLDSIVKGYDERRLAFLERAATEEDRWVLDELPREIAVSKRNEPAEKARYWSGNSGIPEGHPLLKLRQERFELDQAFRRQVDAVLTAEQRRAIPDERAGQAHFFDYSPQGL